jgi:hypothetical protein
VIRPTNPTLLTILLLPLIVALTGCADTVQSGLTGIDITVKYDETLMLDQLGFSGTVGGLEVLPQTNYPNPSRALRADEESLVIVRDDALGGQVLELSVDGMVGGQIVASQSLSTPIVEGRLSLATLTLGDPAVPACQNEQDDDLDGDIDLLDPGCADADDDDERGPGNVCDDGSDDDGDGDADFPADPGCSSNVDESENCSGASCPECDDGVDNDLDGLLDVAADDGCDSSLDDTERGLCDASCALDDSCTETCPGGSGACDLNCTNDNCACDLDCNNATGDCTSLCSGNDVSCNIDCVGQNVGKCLPVCTGSATTCFIDCTGSDACEAECLAGANCLLDCTDNTDVCRFKDCAPGSVTSCPDNVVACNATCP